jgi:hypothetical protein
MLFQVYSWEPIDTAPEGEPLAEGYGPEPRTVRPPVSLHQEGHRLLYRKRERAWCNAGRVAVVPSPHG